MVPHVRTSIGVCLANYGDPDCPYSYNCPGPSVGLMHVFAPEAVPDVSFGPDDAVELHAMQCSYRCMHHAYVTLQ